MEVPHADYGRAQLEYAITSVRDRLSEYIASQDVSNHEPLPKLRKDVC
jgi:hypothetical protein